MQWPQSRSYDETVYEGDVQAIISQVYLLMTIGLVITAIVAAAVAGNQNLMIDLFARTPWLPIGLFVGQIVLVIALTAAVAKMSPTVATVLFVVYSALNGVTMSVIFWVYTDASITTTFLITAITFGLMSVIGYTTKRDLTKLGSLLMMALLGIVIASIVNLFLRSTGIYWVLTFGGIIVFVGLIAWDTQRIKQMALMGLVDGRSRMALAVGGALRLYLDFINLFLLLLRLFGRRR
ncbi:MAG: Bax inhibitor-1/YccA family protein [Anaerolineae bacterium]